MMTYLNFSDLSADYYTLADTVFDTKLLYKIINEYILIEIKFIEA